MKDITVLHDHLDGGLRANTIIELANNLNIELPTKDEYQLENGSLRIFLHKKIKFLISLN